MSITIHHLRRAQSERIVWLCEEVSVLNPNFRYELVRYDRDPVSALAPTALKELSSAHTAPVMMDTTVDLPVTLSESQAIVEYIAQIHGGGNFTVAPGAPEYAQYLSWYNFANGTLQPGLTRLGTIDLVFKALARINAKQGEQNASTVDGTNEATTDQPKGVDALLDMFKARLFNHLDMLNTRLGGAKYLAGEQFTTADIMMVFSLTTMRGFVPYSLKQYPHIVRYLGLIAERPAYIKAFQKAEPGLEPMITAEVEVFDFAAFK